MYNDLFFLKKFKKVRVKRLHAKYRFRIPVNRSRFFFLLKLNFFEEKYDLKFNFNKLS